MADDNPPLLKGTLAVLILKALAWAPMHGFEISAWIEEHSGATFDVDAPGIYQSLYRMEAQGLVDAEWGISEKLRRARYYKLTARGRTQLRQETETWRRYAAGVMAILDAAPPAPRKA
jgi:PadR family transcriptional regulator